MILFALMGTTSYLVVLEMPSQTVLTIYGAQLLFNFLWLLLSFNMAQYLFAFIWPVILWQFLITTVLFYRTSKTAGHLMLTYLV